MSGGTSTADLGRLMRAHPLAVDLAIMLAAGGAFLLGELHGGHQLHEVAQPVALGLAVIAYGAMLLRRRWPVPASIAAIAATTGYLTVAGASWWIIPAPAVALFHLAAIGRQPARLPVIAIASGVALVGVPALVSSGWWAAAGHEESIVGFAACCIALAAGDAARNRRSYLAEVEERIRRTERERIREAHHHIAQERMRIARDLHDSVGHHITLINAQAAMASQVFDTQPDAAREALAHIKAESRAALADLRDTVGLLRQSDEPAAPLGPQPSLTAVEDLVAGFQRSGLPVDLIVDGIACAVTTGVDLAAYRILEESLTNVTKHSPGAPTHVRIKYAADSITMLVDNDWSDSAVPVTDQDGHGLMGMRERATAAGGSLNAGPRSDGGYQVRAVLPLTRPGSP